jgi:NAD(P)-dependent dehydrogenase (short-subunit alcohol dehydrogenase family)
MAAGALANAGLEQFVRHAATEMGPGTRVNVVRPGWVQETLDALGLDRSGTPAAVIAQTYLVPSSLSRPPWALVVGCVPQAARRAEACSRMKSTCGSGSRAATSRTTCW